MKSGFTGSRLFPYGSKDRAALCTQHCMQSYFYSFAGFAVCVHMETELREIVFLI